MKIRKLRYSFLICIVCMVETLAAYPLLPELQNENEALLVRRIIDCWQDKEYSFAQSQIQSYLKEHPNSPFANHFWAMLGEIAMQNKEFSEALAYYDKIQEKGFNKNTQLKKWQLLYHMGHFSKLYQETLPFSHSPDDQVRFYFAEAAFREGIALKHYDEGIKESKALFEEALPIYESLMQNPDLAIYAKLEAAEIYRLLQHPEKAIPLYLELGGQSENEEILFHAASALMHYDKQIAENIFKKLAQEGCSKKSAAAFQWFLLLVEKKDWEMLANHRDLFLSALDNAHLPICYFYLGTHDFQKGIFESALANFRRCINHNLPHQHEKKALLFLLSSCHELVEIDLCEAFFDELTTRFPEMQPEASYVLASAYQKAEEHSRALKMCEVIINDYAKTDFAERATLKKIHLLLNQKKFHEAYSTLVSFLKDYPRTERKKEIFYLAIDICLALEDYNKLAAHIEQGIEENVFSPLEKQEQELALAKTYLKLGKTYAALEIFKQMSKPDPLLLTYCYVQEGASPDKVIFFGEQALLSGCKEENPLHVYLFNAYLELSKKNNKDKQYTHEAARHLAMASESIPISLENRLWLAHYFAKEEPERAIPLLAKLVSTELHLKSFDQEALLLASLYSDKGCIGEAECILEKIAALEQETEDQARLKLAEIYASKGNIDKAKSFYQMLEASLHLEIAEAACLHYARLDFSSSPENSLKKLQDLAKRKTLASEPLHLEAALDYAELKTLEFAEEERPYRLLDLLCQVKEDFTRQDDTLSKEYQASRARFPEKDLVYQAYMRYVDARIYLLQAETAQDALEGKTKLNAAKALFSTLKQGKYAVTRYLKENAIKFYDTQH